MRVKVVFEVNVPDVPDDICKDDIDEWVNYNLGALGGISRGNPLNVFDIDSAENIIVDEL